MPATLGIRCVNEDCEPDMFELHYTYDMPDNVTVADSPRPYYGGSRALEEIQL